MYCSLFHGRHGATICPRPLQVVTAPTLTTVLCTVICVNIQEMLALYRCSVLMSYTKDTCNVWCRCLYILDHTLQCKIHYNEQRTLTLHVSIFIKAIFIKQGNHFYFYSLGGSCCRNLWLSTVYLCRVTAQTCQTHDGRHVWEDAPWRPRKAKFWLAIAKSWLQLELNLWFI